MHLKSRTASLDLAPEEVALMNTPGFAPAPPTSVAIAVPESNWRHLCTPSLVIQPSLQERAILLLILPTVLVHHVLPTRLLPLLPVIHHLPI